MVAFLDQSGQLGGAELCLADILEDWKSEARLILFDEGPFAERMRGRGVPTVVLPLAGTLSAVSKRSGPGGWVRAGVGLGRVLVAIRKACQKADLLYLNTPKAAVLGVAANAPSGQRRVLHLHDLLDETHFSKGNISCFVAAANRCHAVIANSLATAEAYRKQKGRAPLHVVPNGFDADFWMRSRNVKALRAELEPMGRPVAAVFGRLSPWKGQHIALEAVASIPELALWVVGDALYTKEDKTYRFRLQERARRSDLAGRIRFLGQREDIPELMQAADFIIHCSVAAEPFGRVIVEGMLSGRPVVASAAGGPLEILESEATGWLVPPGNPSALAETIRAVLASPARAQAVALKAQATARARYHLPIVLSRIRKILNSVMG